MVHQPEPSVVALVGNPRVGIPHAHGRAASSPAGSGTDVTSIDLATIGHELFTADRTLLDPALRTVAQARLLVVATPVYKASYTGLLKSFLDLYGPDGLAGVVAVPLVISGNPAHALVGEVHLRPLLVELGATVPTRSLTVTEADLADLDPAVDRWLERAAGTARARPVRRPGRSGPVTAEILREIQATLVEQDEPQLSPAAYKEVFRRHPAGVAVVAFVDDGRPVGLHGHVGHLRVRRPAAARLLARVDVLVVGAAVPRPDPRDQLPRLRAGRRVRAVRDQRHRPVRGRRLDRAGVGRARRRRCRVLGPRPHRAARTRRRARTWCRSARSSTGSTTRPSRSSTTTARTTGSATTRPCDARHDSRPAGRSNPGGSCHARLPTRMSSTTRVAPWASMARLRSFSGPRSARGGAAAT